MTQRKLAFSLILTATTVAIALQGCNPGSTLAPIPNQTDGGDQGVGGGSSGATNGGNANNGGNATTGGGTKANGGATSGAVTGGSPAVGTGGTPGVITGGTPAVVTGGTKSTGNTGGNPPSVTGGNPPTATGGNPPAATGGNPPAATGGSPVTTTTGGATTVGNTGKTVTISSSGKGSGAMTGWAFVALGLTDTVSAPTCGTPPVAITEAAKCNTTTNWPAAGVCVTGSVPPNPSPYTSWGINIGLSSTDPSGSGLGQTFANVTIAATGAPAGATFRYIISVGTTDYCAAATPGAAVSFSTFNTKCYDTPIDGVAYTGTGADITGVQLQVVPGTATITVANLCLTGITFGP
jgi:hypothetical protein